MVHLFSIVLSIPEAEAVECWIIGSLEVAEVFSGPDEAKATSGSGS